MIILVVYCDGGYSTKKNRSSPAYGSFLCRKIMKTEKEEIILENMNHRFIQHKPGIVTNNAAEIATLVECLHFIKIYHSSEEKIIVRVDSQFTQEILEGKYDSQKSHLVTLINHLRSLWNRIPTNIILERISGKDMKKILGH